MTTSTLRAAARTVLRACTRTPLLALSLGACGGGGTEPGDPPPVADSPWLVRVTDRRSPINEGEVEASESLVATIVPNPEDGGGGRGSELRVLSRATGTVLLSISRPMPPALLVTDDALLVTHRVVPSLALRAGRLADFEGTGGFSVLDPRTGAERWRRESTTETEVAGGAALLGGTLVTQQSIGTARGFSLANGASLWTTTVPDSLCGTTACRLRPLGVGADGRFHVLATGATAHLRAWGADGTVRVVPVPNGGQFDEPSLGSMTTPGVAWFVTRTEVFGLDPATGTERWRRSLADLSGRQDAQRAPGGFALPAPIPAVNVQSFSLSGRLTYYLDALTGAVRAERRDQGVLTSCGPDRVLSTRVSFDAFFGVVDVATWTPVRTVPPGVGAGLYSTPSVPSARSAVVLDAGEGVVLSVPCR